MSEICSFPVVQVSFDLSEYTANVDALGTLRILDAIRTCQLEDKVKFYQASTSELYGKVQEIPQTETTPFYPRSPYGRLNSTFLLSPTIRFDQLKRSSLTLMNYTFLVLLMYDCQSIIIISPVLLLHFIPLLPLMYLASYICREK